MYICFLSSCLNPVGQILSLFMPIRTLSHLSVLGNCQSICSSLNCLSVCLSVLCAHLSSLCVLTHLSVSLYVCHWIATCISIWLSAGLSVSQSVCLSIGLYFSLPVFLLALQTGLKQGPLLLCANVGLFIISVYPPASLSFFTCSTRTAICLSVCLFVNCYLKLALNELYVCLSLHLQFS